MGFGSMSREVLGKGKRVRLTRDRDSAGVIQREEGDFYVVEPDNLPHGMTQRWGKDEVEAAPPYGQMG